MTSLFFLFFCSDSYTLIKSKLHFYWIHAGNVFTYRLLNYKKLHQISTDQDVPSPLTQPPQLLILILRKQKTEIQVNNLCPFEYDVLWPLVSCSTTFTSLLFSIMKIFLLIFSSHNIFLGEIEKVVYVQIFFPGWKDS